MSAENKNITDTNKKNNKDKELSIIDLSELSHSTIRILKQHYDRLPQRVTANDFNYWLYDAISHSRPDQNKALFSELDKFSGSLFHYSIDGTMSQMIVESGESPNNVLKQLVESGVPIRGHHILEALRLRHYEVFKYLMLHDPQLNADDIRHLYYSHDKFDRIEIPWELGLIRRSPALFKFMIEQGAKPFPQTEFTQMYTMSDLHTSIHHLFEAIIEKNDKAVTADEIEFMIEMQPNISDFSPDYYEEPCLGIDKRTVKVIDTLLKAHSIEESTPEFLHEEIKNFIDTLKLLRADIIVQLTQEKIFDHLWDSRISPAENIITMLNEIQATKKDPASTTLFSEKNNTLRKILFELQQDPEQYENPVKLFWYLRDNILVNNSVNVNDVNERIVFALKKISPQVKQQSQKDFPEEFADIPRPGELRVD